MKSLEEWKALAAEAESRRMPLYVTPDELRELRVLEYQVSMVYLGEPHRQIKDWYQLLGLTGAEVVVDRFAVERRAGPLYQSLVQRLAELDPWVSDHRLSQHTCRFCGSVVLYTARLDDMLSVSTSHTPECVWRLAQELVGFTTTPPPTERRYRP